jgi:hypothetical protein
VIREMKTKRLIVNAAGTISDTGGLSVAVRFDLIGTLDFVDGTPSLEFSFGDLRYMDDDAPQVSSRALFGTNVTLKCGGIQTTILLNNPFAFTVMSEILELAFDSECSDA